MNVQREIPGRLILDRLADENGLAIVVVDENLIEIASSNDNSICRTLNPDGELTGRCRDFCGKALEKAVEAGKPVGFECHAGLDCRAVAMTSDRRLVVAIVGRTFVKADNYRKATTRAINGDWRHFSSTDFFENVLMTGSLAAIDKTVGRLIELAADIQKVVEKSETVEKPIKKPIQALANTTNEIARPVKQMSIQTAATPQLADALPSTAPIAGAAAWRSFFGSILSSDYTSACEAILNFLADQYGFTSLVWLERRENRFEKRAVFGALRDRKVRLGVAADDPRLLDAIRSEMPLELGERSKDSGNARSMYLFPVPVGNEISSALAVLDPISSEALKHQIARLCHSVAPQMEILRLRGEVSQRDLLSKAVRRFGDSLKTIENDDFWMHLTLASADLLQAERASLLVVDPKSGLLEIKAAVGAKTDITGASDPGSRVSQIVFENGKAAVVADVATSGLLPSPVERRYKTASFISSPVALGSRNIAVINFTDKASGENFDKHDLELIRAISPQIAVAIDRASLKDKAGEFQQLSVTDVLTGLLNRRYIEERLMEEVLRSNRHGYPMSFLMLDVDHFKSYNDQFGHPAGDQALRLVAQVLKDTLRGADVAARYGGEEFSILLPQTTDDEAAAIAERVRANIAEAQFSHRQVTVSIGVASCSSELCSTSGLISGADKALYDAKARGRNTVRLYADMEKTEGHS